MSNWTDNPVRDAEYYELENEREEELPECECCGKVIKQEWAFYYNDQWCCEQCEKDFWNDIRDDFLERTRKE